MTLCLCIYIICAAHACYLYLLMLHIIYDVPRNTRLFSLFYNANQIRLCMYIGQRRVVHVTKLHANKYNMYMMACCLLFVACCLLPGCCLLLVACCLLLVACCFMLHLTCCWLLVANQRTIIYPPRLYLQQRGR
jgi:hypothetical protein